MIHHFQWRKLCKLQRRYKNKTKDESEGGNGWNKVSTSEGRLSIPKGTKLVGNERYIRFLKRLKRLWIQTH